MSWQMMLIALLGAHFFLDYAGQGDFMAKAKNCKTAIPGVPYWHPLTAHACIHGAAVALITGFWPFFIAETVVHWITDNWKCRGIIGFTADQLLHIGCKVVFVVAVFA